MSFQSIKGKAVKISSIRWFTSKLFYATLIYAVISGIGVITCLIGSKQMMVHFPAFSIFIGNFYFILAFWILYVLLLFGRYFRLAYLLLAIPFLTTVINLAWSSVFLLHLSLGGNMEPGGILISGVIVHILLFIMLTVGGIRRISGVWEDFLRNLRGGYSFFYPIIPSEKSFFRYIIRFWNVGFFLYFSIMILAAWLFKIAAVPFIFSGLFAILELFFLNTFLEECIVNLKIFKYLDNSVFSGNGKYQKIYFGKFDSMNRLQSIYRVLE